MCECGHGKQRIGTEPAHHRAAEGWSDDGADAEQQQQAAGHFDELVGAGDYRAQATQALHNLRTAVEAAGGTVENIVSSTVYIKGLNGQASEQVMAAMATAIDGKPFPAHAFSMIGVEALSGPELLVEISAIAVLQA